MWAAHLESALGSSQTGLPFQLAASGESRTAWSGLVRARGHRRFVQRGLRATAAGPQRVNHGFFRRLPRTGERTGATLDRGATRIVEDKRVAHITYNARRVIEQLKKAHYYTAVDCWGEVRDVSIAGRGPVRSARKTGTSGDRSKLKPWLFDLPPYAPDHNSGELV